ncbi:TPA: PhzF family phenazine biosynthesis protein [Candidatus Bathyarchaeota archaeon]|nr:PhzF family phenazine biosynthesis protein [Candidatus Bathyarchaeota archaeon]
MGNALFIVDVFAEAKLEGNQLAVVVDKEGWSTEQMQKFTKEMNFSESTFITASDAEKRVFKMRIFTPVGELPFAGHPTLGTAYVAAKELLKKDVPDLTLDMKAGLIPVAFQKAPDGKQLLWMKQLNPEFGATHKAEDIAPMFGLKASDIDTRFPIQEVSTGVWFYIIPLKKREALKRIKLDAEAFKRYSADNKAKWPLLFCPEPEAKGNHLKARMVTDWTEDPATGSANGCLAGYLVKHRYFGTPQIDIRVEQGAEIGRPSILYLRAEEVKNSIDVRVGGKVAMVARGEVA